jgi:hypothetical protein
VEQRNEEFAETMDEYVNQRLDEFVSELMVELDSIQRTLTPDNESHHILMNWVRDKVKVLHDSFQE